MSAGNFRLRICRDLFRTLVVPPLVLAAGCRWGDIRLGYWSLPAYLLSIVVAFFARVQYSELLQAREARQLGARPIPRVVGKWPGNIDVMLRLSKAFKDSYIYDPYLELFEEYQSTTLNTRILWTDSIISMDQEHCKYVLATGFSHFWRGTAQRERMEHFLGSGIFNRDDEAWKNHRTVARPFFARNRISDFDLIEKHAQRTLSIVSQMAESNRPCDLQDLYARFSLDAASEFLFGSNLDTLSKTMPQPGEQKFNERGSCTEDSWGTFVQAFEGSQQLVMMRGRAGVIWPLKELFGDKMSPYAATIKEWINPLVLDALRHKKINPGSPIAEKNFLEHLADSTEDADVIRDQLLSMLLASRDTTACLLTYVTYFMAMHPDVTQKLRREVLSVCGQSTPTFENIKQMRYMRAVIDETLRLFPPVPLNQRQSRPTSCTLPPPDPTFPAESRQPLYMPKSTTFFYSTLLMQRNKALWGPDGDKFDPERWIDPQRLSKFTSNPMMFTPFSAGPRICIGQNYAYNEASYFLARLLQRFDTFSLAPDAQPGSSLPPQEWKCGRGRKAVEQIRPEAAMTLFVKGGLWVRMGKASTH
ncbi:cytochrome P450 monooxygenase CYP63 [Coniophora puteana RWD-64-598 SS2]|uniref:Cytochrome P450 monooxygenase CYP63 n=1 Tax=Coniophora puteana (strain RWD-64-598) TaxID=741705 RepID=A0A5M3MFQ7_CONPW|nr:cytochrome P450 monooxygenase CYP63 [Coniophora puteana RWD-64-598 SS2]EIW77750.1 cytochrome P450 monooxygenase CYP63 [Coniophora puteana RWD-64-598 SS2]